MNECNNVLVHTWGRPRCPAREVMVTTCPLSRVDIVRNVRKMLDLKQFLENLNL